MDNLQGISEALSVMRHTVTAELINVINKRGNG